MIQPQIYFLSVLDNWGYWAIYFFGSFFFYFLVNWWVCRKPINGMLGIIVSSSLISASVFDLYANSNISNEGILHFFLTDIFITVLVFIYYKKSINYINKFNNLDKLINYSNKYYLFFLVLLFLDFLINYFNVFSADNIESRILFQNDRWYSLVRFLVALISPILSIIPFIYLREKNYRRAALLIIISIASSIMSGSKSGFIIALINSFLVYRDLFEISKNESIKYIKIIIAIGFIAIINLQFIGTDFEKFAIRIASYGESTVMVYASDDPTLACKNNSYIANLHRGLGRVLGDESSLKFETLFGIALSNIYYGDNSTTGPNARIGAYVYCAFPGLFIFFYYGIISLFILILWKVFILMLESKGIIRLIGMPFFSFNIQSVLDYNIMASVFSSLIIIYLTLNLKKILFKYNIFKV